MKNEIGNKYGRLTVIRRATEEEYLIIKFLMFL